MKAPKEVLDAIEDWMNLQDDVWTAQDALEGVKGATMSAVTSKIAVMRGWNRIERVETCKSGSGGYWAVYLTLHDDETTIRTPEAADDLFAKLIGDKRFEDVKFKVRTP